MKKISSEALRNVALIGILIGVWVIVLQNAGVLDTNRSVHVTGGQIDADIESKNRRGRR